LIKSGDVHGGNVVTEEWEIGGVKPVGKRHAINKYINEQIKYCSSYTPLVIRY
jgi:hypothetical protein